jgi:predicted transcriptional regulator of viral defense system
MKFDDLLSVVDKEPVFETGFLLSGDVDAFLVRKQLSRWTASGKLIQLRRGLYCLAPLYQKTIPHPFLIANRLVPASYVSLQAALAYYDLIPEKVAVVTSITTRRTIEIDTEIGRFDFHSIQTGWFTGYRRVDLGSGQQAFVASPEKALLDLVHLRPQGDEERYLRSMRLQKLDQLDMEELDRLSSTTGKPKLTRAVKEMKRLINEENSEYEVL